MSKDRGRILSEYRRSNASGIHSSSKPRKDEESEALAFELKSHGLRRDNMSTVTYVDFGGPNPDLDELDEPTDEDLRAIEDDWDLLDDMDRYFEPDLYGDDDDDRFPFDNYGDDYDYDEDY